VSWLVLDLAAACCACGVGRGRRLRGMTGQRWTHRLAPAPPDRAESCAGRGRPTLAVTSRAGTTRSGAEALAKMIRDPQGILRFRPHDTCSMILPTGAGSDAPQLAPVRREGLQRHPVKGQSSDKEVGQMNGWDVRGLRRRVYQVPVLLVAVLTLIVGTAPRGALAQDDDCSSSGGPAVKLPAAKLIIEHNATDEDTGVHGLFDGVNWTKLCVYDPDGVQILVVQPKGQLREQSISGIFFESAEPPNSEVSIDEFKSRFPEGLYAVRGRAKDGRRLTGAAQFTHTIPAAPVIAFPQDGGVVDASNLVVSWNPVTMTLDGKPLNPTGYQVIITKDVKDDPNGFSRPTFDVHVLPSVTSLTVSKEFLEPKTTYELEVLALEASGNQTISVLFFQTQ
jgi:hypothetical protein